MKALIKTSPPLVEARGHSPLQQGFAKALQNSSPSLSSLAPRQKNSSLLNEDPRGLFIGQKDGGVVKGEDTPLGCFGGQDTPWGVLVLPRHPSGVSSLPRLRLGVLLVPLYILRPDSDLSDSGCVGCVTKSSIRSDGWIVFRVVEARRALSFS